MMVEFNNWWDEFVFIEEERDLETFHNLKKESIFLLAKEANILSKLSKNITFKVYSVTIDNKIKYYFEWFDNNKKETIFKKEINRKE